MSRQIQFAKRVQNTLVKELSPGRYGVDPQLPEFLPGSVLALDEATLKQIAADSQCFQNGSAMPLDADGGTLTGDTTLGYSDANRHATSGTLTVTLPAPSADFNGWTYRLKNLGGTLTIQAASANIDGSPTYVASVTDESLDVQLIDGSWCLV